MTDTALEREAIALFEEMLALPEAERDAWAEARTEGRPELRARLTALRESDRKAMLRTGAAIDGVEEEAPPFRVGAYRITGRIGSGGMGSVYRGERDTGDFAHAVAIKIIRPGLLSERLVERFRRERQTLAQLVHPHIARLYDGGETESGSPYIVMELVDGLPLMQWAEETRPSLARRQALFADICEAVAFAHRSLVVHRDLTPSNVLVTREGMVKLIDFGIARPADRSEPDAAAEASIGSLSLTPGYAAPERMASARVTTAADVYSLGKLLEKFIVRPGDAELAAIVARATATRPEDRYPTADALGADVAAWAQGKPVAAVGGGRAYLVRKFVRRHRLAVGASAAAIALLVTAATVATVSTWRAETARAAEAQRFGEVRALARYLLFDLNDRLERIAGNTGPRAEIAARAQSYLSTLAASPNASPELRIETAEGLIRLARIQGVPNEPNLGQRDLAKTNLETARRLLEPLAGSRETGAAAAVHLAHAMALQSVIALHGDSKQEEARALITKAESLLGGVPADRRALPWHEARRSMRKAALEIADLTGSYDEMPAIIRQSEADIAGWPLALRRSAEALDRANAAFYRGLHGSMTEADDGGLPHFLDAERRLDALQAASPDDPAVLYLAVWNAYGGFAAGSTIGREEVSGRMIGKAADAVDRLLRIEDRDDSLHALALNIKEAQAQNLRDQERFSEAIALQQQVIARRRALMGDTPGPNALGNLAFSQAILGVIARDGGRISVACASWAEAEKGFTALKTRGELLDFHDSFLPGLRSNGAKCRAGVTAKEAFGPLRG